MKLKTRKNNSKMWHIYNGFPLIVSGPQTNYLMNTYLWCLQGPAREEELQNCENRIEGKHRDDLSLRRKCSFIRRNSLTTTDTNNSTLKYQPRKSRFSLNICWQIIILNYRVAPLPNIFRCFRRIPSQYSKLTANFDVLFSTHIFCFGQKTFVMQWRFSKFRHARIVLSLLNSVWWFLKHSSLMQKKNKATIKFLPKKILCPV